MSKKKNKTNIDNKTNFHQDSMKDMLNVKSECALAMQNEYKRRQCNINQITDYSVEMLRLNVVQMAHAELISSIYRSILQPTEMEAQSVKAATWSG